VVNRLHFLANEVARGNQIDLSVRYEKRKWELNANYTMFEYNQSNFGIGFRYWWFVIGSDRLFQIFGLSDAKAFDVFFGIKANLCELALFRKGGQDCPAYGSK
jgi:hypothetical protein